MRHTNNSFSDYDLPHSQEDLRKLRNKFLENDEFILIPKFLPRNLIELMQNAVENLRTDVHRSYIPNHKKGGSVPRTTLDKKAPIFSSLYVSNDILQFFNLLSGKQLLHCPDHDLHACALYLYTQKGDHIDFHFDTSYYAGLRYTALLGVINRSGSVLEYELFHKTRDKNVVRDVAPIEPGTLVFFNGDKLRHRVTPCETGEERVVLTLEYVTNPNMGLAKRFISNMKDAIAYFGFKRVFRRQKS